MPSAFSRMISATRAERILRRAQKLERRGRWGSAWPEFERAVAAGPADARTLAQHGLALSRAGLHERAAERLRKAAELDPENPAHLFGLAMVLCDVQRWNQADEAAADGLQLSPGNPLGHTLGILVQMGRGDVPGACRKLLEREPTDNMAVRARLFVFIESWLMRHDPMPLSFILQPQVDDDPPEEPDQKASAARLFARGESLADAGRYRAAIACLAAAHEKKPDRADILVSLGGCFVAAGEWARSIEYLSKVPHDDPAAVYAAIYHAIALIRTGEPDEAAALLNPTATFRDLGEVKELIDYLRGLAAIARGDLIAAARLMAPLLDAEWSLLTNRAHRVIELAEAMPDPGRS